MAAQLPPEIEVRQELDAVHYVFPRRELGRERAGGAVVLIFGLFVTTFMVFWMSGPLSDAFDDDGVVQWFMLVFGLLGLPGLFVGLGLVLLGLVIIFNVSHVEVVVSRENLVTTERAGPLRWRRKRRLADIDRFVVGHALRSARRNAPQAAAFPAHGAAIRAEGHGIKPLVVAPAYPRDWLKALADVLADAIEDLRRERLGHVEDIEVVEEKAPVPGETGAVEENPVPQPEKSLSVYEELDNGFSISIPPAGLWKGSKGLFAFSLVWNVFVLIFFSAFGFAMVKDSDGAPPVMAILMCLLFFGVGIGILIGAINMGRRRVMLAGLGDTLAWRRIGPFGQKEQKLRRDEVSAVRVGPSGMEVNDRPVMELQVMLVGGKKLGLLSQLDREELEWIAYVIRKYLGVRSNT